MSYSLPEFLAHAVALENEAADRYLELADMMEAHRNDDVATLFREMVRFSQMHRDEIVARVGDMALPELATRDYRWRASPEAGGEEGFDYRIDAHRALVYARENEVRAMEYYRSIFAEAADPELRRLAGEFADDESDHVAALDRWLDRTPRK